MFIGKLIYSMTLLIATQPFYHYSRTLFRVKTKVQTWKILFVLGISYQVQYIKHLEEKIYNSTACFNLDNKKLQVKTIPTFCN